MAVVQQHYAATFDFIRRHRTLFEETIDPKTLNHHIALREGAPLRQMLEAPDDFVDGSAEPWIVDILCALLKANDQPVVLETGAFVGGTAERLGKTLVNMGGGELIACEIDGLRAGTVQDRLVALQLPSTVRWRVVCDDVLTLIPTLADASLGFVWVDDDHGKDHVTAEIHALTPKMAPSGIICFHDVWGSCDLQSVVTAAGGYALDLPRLGAAGGLGILQVR